MARRAIRIAYILAASQDAAPVADAPKPESPAVAETAAVAVAPQRVTKRKTAPKRATKRKTAPKRATKRRR